MNIYRNYWKCKRCGNRWSFDSNLYDYDCRCPECGKLATTKTWECVQTDYIAGVRDIW